QGHLQPGLCHVRRRQQPVCGAFAALRGQIPVGRDLPRGRGWRRARPHQCHDHAADARGRGRRPATRHHRGRHGRAVPSRFQLGAIMSELASLLGVAVDYAYQGKTYKVSRRTLRIEAAMEVWAENQALDAIERQRGRISAEALDRLFAIWERDVASAEVYCSEGEVITRAINCPGPGQRRLCLLQLTYATDQPHQATAEMVDSIFRDRTDDFAAYKALLLAMARADGRVPNVPQGVVSAG